ncbi:MAG TPA: glycosyltransferase family 39 protein [Candidatus Binatia bacterium]|nr:glycosyltransferase family 39 protein [Candidatus Binatia bacterium]
MSASAASQRGLTAPSSELILSFAAALLLAAAVLFKDLGLEGVAADEATATARVVEMLEDGHWLVPTLDGETDLNKPPLKLWVVAATIRLFGPNEFALRFWDAAAGVAIVALTFLAAARFGGGVAGLTAALVVVTVPRFLFDHTCRSNTYDSFLIFFVTAAVLHHAFGERSKRAAALTGCLCGLALLSKGIAAIPLLGIIVIFELQGQGLGIIRSARLWTVIATAACVAGLWYVPALLLAPHTLAKELRFEIGSRAFGESAFANPTLFFWQAGATFRYWVIALVPGLLALRGGLGGEMLVIWPVVWLAAFGVASIPQPWYDLPAYPAVAALIGIGVASAADSVPVGNAPMRRLAAACAVLAAFTPSYYSVYQRTGMVRWTHSDLRRFADWAGAALPAEVPVLVLRAADTPPLFAQHERLDVYKLRPRIRHRASAAELCDALGAAKAAFAIVPAESIGSIPCLHGPAGTIPLRPTFYSHAFPFVDKDIVAYGMGAPPFFAVTEVMIDVAAGQKLAAGWAVRVDERGGKFVRAVSGDHAVLRFDLPPFVSPVIRFEAADSDVSPGCDPEVRFNGEPIGSFSKARSSGLALPPGAARLTANEIEVVRTCPGTEIAVAQAVVRDTAASDRLQAGMAHQYLRGHRLVGQQIADPDSPTGQAFVTGGSYGMPGFLFFLPLDLPASSYEVTFDLRAGRLATAGGIVLLDVIEGDRGPRLSTREVPVTALASDRQYVPVRLRFDIGEAKKLQLRVETRDRSEIRLGRIEVRPTWTDR